MKKILLFTIVSLISYTQLCAQEYFAQEVVECELSKEQLWGNLNKWVAKTFNSPQNVIEVEDKDAGMMTIKFIQPIGGDSFSIANGNIKAKVEATVTIDIKDHKFRYTIPVGSVEVSAGHIDLRRLPTSSLERAMNDLEFLIDVSERLYNGGTSWRIDDRFNNIMSEYLQKQATTPETDKRGRKTEERVYVDDKVMFLQDIKNGYDIVMNAIPAGLKSALVINDDW